MVLHFRGFKSIAKCIAKVLLVLFWCVNISGEVFKRKENGMKLHNYDYDLKNENPKLRDCNGDALYKFLLYKAEDSSFDCDRCTCVIVKRMV